ncbi:MAG: hypothetical protein NVS3B10_24510 [Polyangiales bacterium]
MQPAAVETHYRAPAPLAPPPTPPRATTRWCPLVLEVEGANVVAQIPRSLYFKRALLFGAVVPGLLLLALVRDEFTAIVCGALTAASLLGAVLLGAVFGPRLSRASRVVIDRTEHAIVRAKTGQRLPFAAIEGIRVVKRAGVSQWTALEVWSAGRPAIVVHERLAPMHAADVAAYAYYLAALLQVPTDAAPATAAVATQKDNTHAMLCYLPVQGVHFFASLWFVFTARDRPLVHFAARQSLLQLAATVVGLGAIGVAFGVPVAALDDGPVRVVMIVLLVIGLAVVAIGNLVAHGYAAYQAHKGRAWVRPWLGFLVRRWLPPAG